LASGGDVAGGHGDLEAKARLELDRQRVGRGGHLVVAEGHILIRDANGVKQIDQLGVDGGIFACPKDDQ